MFGKRKGLLDGVELRRRALGFTDIAALEVEGTQNVGVIA
jgi:hypothetical protein